MSENLWADPELFQSYLRQKGWSKAELARRTNMNPTTISLISLHRAAAYPSQAERICEAFGIPQEALFPASGVVYQVPAKPKPRKKTRT